MKGVDKVKKLIIITIAAVLVFAAGAFAVLSLNNGNEKEPEPSQIKLSQAEINNYKDIIYGAVGIGRYFTDTTLGEVSMPWSDDPVEREKLLAEYHAKAIDYKDHKYYLVSPDEPYQTLGELKADLSRYFSAKAVEDLLAKGLYIERDGKLYVSPGGKGSSEDYSRIIISPDVTVSKEGAKTLSAEVPEAEWAESSETTKTEIVFVTEDGVDKIEKMTLHGYTIGGYAGG